MAAKTPEKTLDVWKRKKWHRVLAPKLFNEMVIGETPALEPNMLVGRTLKINMVTLTGDMKKQMFDVVFEIEKVMGDTAYTIIKRYEMSPAAVRRFVRRDRNRVDDSFICKTADNKIVRIKPFMVTFSKTSNSVLNSIRKKSSEFIARGVATMSYDDLCREIVNYSLQKALREMISKVYPLRFCDIRVLELYKGESKNILKVAALPAESRGAAPQQASQEEGKEQAPVGMRSQAAQAEEAEPEQENKDISKKTRKTPKPKEKETK